MDRSLTNQIDMTLGEIGRGYHPGLILWIKRHPDRWAKLLDLESRINQAALKRDVEALKETSSQYKGFIVNMAGIFKTPKRETKNLFNLN